MRSFCVPTLVIFLILHNARWARGQMYWQKLFDSLAYKENYKPAPRRDAAIGHDIGRNRIIVFGGWQTNVQDPESTSIYNMPVIFDDTWEFNLDTKTWRPLSFSLMRPSARYGMLYTHTKHGLIISCGRGWLEEYFNDLWIYDYHEDQWHRMDQQFISMVPEARFSPVGGMYPGYEFFGEPSKQTLLLAMGRSQYTMYDNMYAYTFTDLRSLNGIWEFVYTDIFTGPYSYTHPHGRSFAASTMVSPDELLVYGGCLSGAFSGGPCPSTDSWVYSYSRNKWDKVDSHCVSPRMFSAMASLVSDGNRHAAIMFSGLEKDRTVLKVDQEYEDEVIIYDSFTMKWARKKVQGFFYPEKRNGHSMCTAKYKNEFGVFMFGGFGHHSDYNLADVWFLRVNVTSVFDNAITTNFYSPNALYNFDICSFYFTTIHMHAIFMFAGWAVFIYLGALIDKYFNSSEPRRKSARIFYYVMQAIGIILVSIGMLLGFWSAHGLPHLAHSIIGIASYILLIANPIGSILKRSTKKFDYYVDEQEKEKADAYKSSMLYYVTNLIRRNLTHTAILLGTVNISLGVLYAVFEWYWLVIWFCYLAIVICVYALVETQNYLKRARARKKLNEKLGIRDQGGEEENNDQFNADNLSKTGSTQHLTSASSMSSSRQAREDISMQPMRYTPSNLGRLDSASNTTTNNVVMSNLKNSPQTPPPPYFTRTRKQQWSNTRANEQGSNHILASSYSQQINASFRDDFDLDVVSNRSSGLASTNTYLRVNMRHSNATTFSQQNQPQLEMETYSDSSFKTLTADSSSHQLAQPYRSNNILNNSRY